MTKLQKQITEANEAYRNGNALITDQEYDALIDQLDTNDPLRNAVGHRVTGSRKEKLPFAMFSMNKIKSIDEMHDWFKSSGISSDTKLIVTPKYDGLSFLTNNVNNNIKAFTRGDGNEGQRSDSHLNVLNSSKAKIIQSKDSNIIGEVIMSKKVFDSKYSKDFKNPRNLVAGMFNKKDPQSGLKDVQYVCYGIDKSIDKSDQIDLLNSMQDIQVPYISVDACNITHSILEDAYTEWSKDFEIDGVIVEVNDYKLRERIGKERNENPKYARAYKGFLVKEVETEILDITFGISKEGKFCPVANVKPVDLGGVTISNVTLNNCKYIVDNKIAVGSVVKIFRSGDVIPKIASVVKTMPIDLPNKCPSCGSTPSWDETSTFLMCSNSNCPDQLLAKIVSFFEILGVDNVGEGVCRQLFDTGYTTVPSILSLTVSDFNKIDGFQKKKSELVYKNIHTKLKDVSLEKLQHASNLFHGLGSKKLKLLNQFDSIDNIPTFDQIVAIDGFSDKSANVYLNNIASFWDFVKDLPITITKKVSVVTGGKCDGFVVVYTGVRDKESEAKIEALGGKIGGSVSSKTTHLICKDKTSNSGKVKKAKELGTCEIWEADDMVNFLV